MVLVALLYNREATKNLVEMVERQSVAIDTIVSNTIWTRYKTYFTEAAEMDAATLRARAETAELHAAIAMATEGIPVLKVKIYSPAGMVMFSSDMNEIGTDHADNEAIGLAVEHGITSSELSYEDRVSAFSGEAFERDVVETYLPIRNGHGGIAGVFELYTDVTEIKARIDSTTLRLSIGLAAIFAAVYAVLVIGVLRRAIAPIRLASRRAARIGPQTTEMRLPIRSMPREILPLIEAINGALDRLDDALDSQRRFTADAAHELLTPLAVLRAQIESLDEQDACPLRRDIDAMTDIVRQLLLLSELDSLGDAIGAGKVSDLHDVAVGVLALLAPLAGREGKEIALTGDPGPIMVEGPPDMLGRALRNLVENAIRHTPAGGDVIVELHRDGRVQVIDRGPGVPAAMRDVIFERFWRAERGGEGAAGLGLAIVKRIANLVGGNVRVEDADGGGACFVMELARAGARVDHPPANADRRT